MARLGTRHFTNSFRFLHHFLYLRFVPTDQTLQDARPFFHWDSVPAATGAYPSPEWTPKSLVFPQRCEGQKWRALSFQVPYTPFRPNGKTCLPVLVQGHVVAKMNYSNLCGEIGTSNNLSNLSSEWGMMQSDTKVLGVASKVFGNLMTHLPLTCLILIDYCKKNEAFGYAIPMLFPLPPSRIALHPQRHTCPLHPAEKTRRETGAFSCPNDFFNPNQVITRIVRSVDFWVDRKASKDPAWWWGIMPRTKSTAGSQTYLKETW